MEITFEELVVEEVIKILVIFLFFSSSFTTGKILKISPILAPWIQMVFLLFGIIAFVIGKKQKDFIDNASPEANDYKKFRGALFGIDVIRSI